MNKSKVERYIFYIGRYRIVNIYNKSRWYMGNKIMCSREGGYDVLSHFKCMFY